MFIKNIFEKFVHVIIEIDYIDRIMSSTISPTEARQATHCDDHQVPDQIYGTNGGQHINCRDLFHKRIIY